MTFPAMAGVMRQLRKLVTARPEDDCSDQTLLQRFVTRKDEAAFAALVGRHGPMVWGTVRRVVGDLHDAEDAFQGTWLVLARKAGSIRRQASVGSWLHGVACRVAVQVRAASRRQHALRAATPPAEQTGPEADVTLRELLALLDEELRRLPERCRGPLVLCYLEGKTQDEAARQLGWGKSTLRRRLERGRELLRNRLARRGVSLPAALTAVGLMQVGAPGAPRADTALAALLYQTNPSSAGVSVRAVMAAQGALAAMQAARVKAVAALLLTAAALATGAGAFAYHARATIGADADAGADGGNEEVVVAPRRTSPWGPWARGLRLRVTAPTVTEQGMELGAEVEMSCDPKRLDRGVKNLNTFLYPACLELTLRSERTGKVVTVRPHDPSGGMLAIDSGEHRGPLTGEPLRPWEVAFPLLQARRDLAPGFYACQVRYTFPTEATERWRRGAEKWDEAGFWRGTAVSGSFRLQITKETTKRRAFLLPKRLRLIDGIKVGFAAEDAEAVTLPVRNGYYLATYIAPGGYQGGPPEPGRSYFQQLQVSALPEKRVTCSLALFETSQPPCHFWMPEAAPGYKVLWKRTLTLELPGRDELLRLHREHEERLQREANKQ
jgi:RNA polymerase sigma factor (sigma-70 family)